MSTQSLDTVRRLAVETLNVPASTLLVATSLKEAGIDSLAIIDLVFTIEAHFGPPRLMTLRDAFTARPLSCRPPHCARSTLPW
jgi:hypothetical protein